MKINTVFIDPDGSDSRRTFCAICSQYYQWFGGEIQSYRCPNCGVQATTDQLMTEQDNIISPAHVSEPAVASKKSEKQKRDPDLPPGAVWISDETTNPD